MQFLKKWLKYIGKREEKSLDSNELRLIFQNRYHNFKLLLNANNRSLEVMTEIEERLRGREPFGMTFIRSRVTRVSASVFQMIQYLNNLSSQRYLKLYSRFRDIEESIRQILETKITTTNAPLVIPMDELSRDSINLAGSKMATLGELKHALGIKVPDGFVITSEAYRRFLMHNDLISEINRLIQKTAAETIDNFFALSSSIQQLILNSRIPEEVEDAIICQTNEMLKKHGPSLTFALRSSALGEDTLGHSFAGQYRSILNVNPDHILQSYKEVVASMYGLPAMTYRFRHGIRDEDVAMCVGCLAMIDPIASGVVYTKSPFESGEEDNILIHSVWGLPKPVVDGSLEADLFVVSRREPFDITSVNLAIKDVAYISLPEEGVARVEMPPHQWDIPSLTEDQMKELAGIALSIERYYGRPQDIEWALDGMGNFIILQSRPLQVRGHEKSQDDQKIRKPFNPEHVILKGGVTASPGVASGKAFVVKRDADALRFPDGAILVTELALPRWASLLGRASAVITEVGNVAGHLANVAREFKIPAIFGLSGATRLLREGDEITIDADERVVLKGLDAIPLSERETEKGMMIGTPVYKVLYDVSRLIVPLYLTDPDSIDFKPDKCSTYHDITRFCHEMSVREMFRFGSEFKFAEKAAKRLVTEKKMQFWILDLNDGFHQGAVSPDAQYVRIEDIASIPMIALWEGMMSVPWGGPPPIKAKGFLSVLAESTINPSLDPAVANNMAIKNYFMISKNFCSLQSRFGYHFSEVEALVSERTRENYASFHFKGGAANLDRRVLRAKFIASLLDLWRFRCTVNGDALSARIEGRDIEEMKDALRVLGYLIIHTRQLDMVMTDPQSVTFYREKMLADLQKLCNVLMPVLD
ncbi:MAG: PEP-utilizing enzyme [Syntrophobacterales bacterium]|nr:PEP-utilizing enzyme [Syntrophobacterales bacterium]